MDEIVLIPKRRRPAKVRKPSRPLDGINHRLLREQAAAAAAAAAATVSVAVPDDDAPPTRSELEQQATLLGLKFDGRTSDARLLDRINEAMKGA